MMMIIMHFFHSNKNEASSPVYAQNKRQSILDCLFIFIYKFICTKHTPNNY